MVINFPPITHPKDSDAQICCSYKFKIIQQIHENLRNTNQRNHQEVAQEDSGSSFQSQNYRRGKCLSRKVIKDRLALPLHRRAWNADVVWQPVNEMERWGTEVK